MPTTNRKPHIIRDLSIIAISVVIAIIFIKSGLLEDLLAYGQSSKILGSFLGGMFLVSIFTAVPATVTLIEIAQTFSVFWMAFFGAFGALIGDYLIFRFIKDSISEDILYLIEKSGHQRWLNIFHLRIFGWLIPFLGAIIVASPLPDEVGIAMMGISKLKTSLFIPLIFTIDFLGILALGLIARALF